MHPPVAIYEKIAEHYRQLILSGSLAAGSSLPTLRQVAARWNCTVGTAQHAFQLLAEEGLINSLPGAGTVVRARDAAASLPGISHLVRATEEYASRALQAGFSYAEIENALREVLDRLRVPHLPNPDASPAGVIRFAGSHDLALSALVSRLPALLPGITLDLSFTGSLTGLISLSQGEVDLAGCHLWDAGSDSYNLPFIQRILPGKPARAVTLAHRSIGLILPSGNPLGITRLEDLLRPEVHFINRQEGSGSRVWLDARLAALAIPTDQISGYDQTVSTHTAVGLSIKSGQANAGLGLQAVAGQYHLAFVPLTEERYDLVYTDKPEPSAALKSFINWLSTPAARKEIARIPGYSNRQTGKHQLPAA
jgi:putative molybdopterin biosynthesis protein